MSNISRAEFIKNNFGRVHRLDIRATVGALTMPTPEEEQPIFKRADVLRAGALAGLKERIAHYHVREEVQQMARLGMVRTVKYESTTGKGHATTFERTESEPLARHSWDMVRKGALVVAELFPDALENQPWQEFVAPLQERP